jgi:hypothetical protein
MTVMAQALRSPERCRASQIRTLRTTPQQQVCPRARRAAHADRGLVCGGYGGAARFHVRRDPSDQLRGRQEGLAGLYDHWQPRRW